MTYASLHITIYDGFEIWSNVQLPGNSFYNVGNHVLWAWSETKGYASRKSSA